MSTTRAFILFDNGEVMATIFGAADLKQEQTVADCLRNHGQIQVIGEAKPRTIGPRDTIQFYRVAVG